jgi:hypothetical protein
MSKKGIASKLSLLSDLQLTSVSFSEPITSIVTLLFRFPLSSKSKAINLPTVDLYTYSPGPVSPCITSGYSSFSYMKFLFPPSSPSRIPGLRIE